MIGGGWGGARLLSVRGTTVGGRLQGRLGLCCGLCDACAPFCFCYQSPHVHLLCLSPSLDPSLSSSPVAPLGSPYLSGCCDSSALFARSSSVLLEVKKMQ